MTTLTQDTRTIGTLSQDGRASVASLTQDTRATAGKLWSSTIYPWQLDFPWLWEGNGQIITLDTRN